MTIRRIFSLLAAISFASVAMAHTNHTSISEVEWNAQSQRFEVAMRLHIVDLENAVSVITGEKFRLEGNQSASKQLASYLAKRFAIRSDEDQATTLHWVGMELELHDAWVYFELEVRPQSTGATVTSGRRQKDSVKHWDQLFSDVAPSKNEPMAASTVARISKAKQLQIENSVLFDIQPEQKNIVSVRMGDRTNSVTLVPGKPNEVLDITAKRKWQVGNAQKG